MTAFASLPMYDWPEMRAEVNGFYARLRALVPGLPARLTRPRTEQELTRLWHDPGLMLAQTCWGPMGAGLARHVHVLAQPAYEGVTGGRGIAYRSAIVMRGGRSCPVPETDAASMPVGLAGLRVAVNAALSLSGCLALEQDAGLTGLARRARITGSHRASLHAVAEGTADLAAIDCRTWAMAQQHEPVAAQLVAIGWTALRPGLPYITARATPKALQLAMTDALVQLGARPVPTLKERS